MKTSIVLLCGALSVMFLYQNCSSGDLEIYQSASVQNISVRSLSPSRAANAETVQLTVYGENFDDDVLVQVGTSYCRNVNLFSSGTLTCEIGPVREVGVVDVSVIHDNGESSSNSGNFEWYEMSLEEKCQRSDFVTTSNIAVNFPARTTTCAFGNGDNGGAVGGLAQARSEQVFNLNLPSDAAVCDIQFNFPTQSFVYDDDIILTFGDIILMSTLGHTVQDMQLLGGSSYLYVYNWSQLVGTSMTGRYNYCAGEDRGYTFCTIPATQVTGTFALNIQSQLFSDILSSSTPVENEFTFITIGDDDASDCQHSGFNFTANVSYVQK